jgi:hypothetical protein
LLEIDEASLVHAPGFRSGAGEGAGFFFMPSRILLILTVPSAGRAGAECALFMRHEER